jgi:hypothetical protein
MIRLATAIALLFALCLPASATTYLVKPDGSGDFPTIHAALDAASGGDTIVLTDGTFRGEGNRDLRFDNKDLTIRSQSGDPRLCIIDCESSVGDSHYGFDLWMQTSATIIQGLTVANGRRTLGGAIYFTYAAPIIQDCIFQHNTASAGGGAVDCDLASAPTFIRCTFWANSAQWGGAMCM